jgi:energy-coupling factor transporter ATP-binding protein EcfA2
MDINSLKAQLFKQESEDGYSLLHGGAVQFGNKIIMLAAASCSGKSTLLFALSQLGYKTSDEYILMKLIDGEICFKVSGMPFALSPNTVEMNKSALEDRIVEDFNEAGTGKAIVYPLKRLFYEGSGQGIIFIEPVKENGQPLPLLKEVTDTEAGILLMQNVVRNVSNRNPLKIEHRRKTWDCINEIIVTMPLFKVSVPWSENINDVALRLAGAIDSRF